MSDQHDHRHGLDRCTCGRLGIDHLPWELSTQPIVPPSQVDLAAAETARKEWGA